VRTSNFFIGNLSVGGEMIPDYPEPDDILAGTSQMTSA
jgi:hypothetical protein